MWMPVLSKLPKTKVITEDVARALYEKILVNVQLERNRQEMERFVIEFKQKTIVQKFVDPTYVQSYQQLTKTHPLGTAQRNNRWSGNFLGLTKSCGTYLGLGPVQTGEITAHLKPKVGAFGIDAELTHYTNLKDSKTNESNQEYGVRVHGARRMNNGKINPVLGAGGKYIVQYRLAKSIRLLNLDFSNPEFRAILDWVGSDKSISSLLPRGVSLSDLFLSEEAATDRLLHQSLAAALYEARHLLKIDGVVTRSARGDAIVNTQDASVICIWSDDDAVLDSLQAFNVSYFNFDDPLPRLVGMPVNGSTDFQKLRDQAKRANKE